MFLSPKTEACVSRVQFSDSMEPVMCVDDALELVLQQGYS